MSNLEEKLGQIRGELDLLDERLVAMLNERASLAQRIGHAKAEGGLTVYAPDREREVLERVCALNSGPMPAEALRCVYRELMSASLALERAPRIAILGPPGSYSHLAGRRRFGSSVEFEMVSSITAVFDEIEHDHAEYALVPVENSIVGGVGETLDALIDRDVRICGEINLAVHHHLLGRGPMESLTRIYSKPEVFAQCQRWLMETGLSSKTIPETSSSAAAERAAREPGTGAIASDLAAQLFDLSKIAEFVEDEPGNVTRFLIIGRTDPKPTGCDKTSLIFSVGHRPGELVVALDRFRSAGINMTRIESRCDRRKKWGYYFFVDIEGHAASPDIAAVLEETSKLCPFWKVLGSYPSTVDVV